MLTGGPAEALLSGQLNRRLVATSWTAWASVWPFRRPAWSAVGSSGRSKCWKHLCSESVTGIGL